MSVLRREGFWNDERNSYPFYPMPVASDDWLGKVAFVEALRKLEGTITVGGNRRYRGWSTCRMCGAHNGSIEYEHDGWLWPEGYRHYIEEHNVRPSLAFQEFVLGEHLGKATAASRS